MDAPNDAAVKCCPLPVYPLGPGCTKYAYVGRFVPWLRENAGRYDIVVVNGIWQYQCFGTWRALHKSSTPYVVFTHGMLDPWFKRTYPLKHLKKWMYWPWGGYRPLRDAGAVVFTCEEERTLARHSFWLYKVREAVVGYGTAGPTGDPAVQKAAFLQLFPELQGKRLCTYLGRLHPRKGCDLAVQAYGKALAENPDWQLVVVGPDPVGWKAVLTGMAEGLGIADRITWAGVLSGDAKWGSLHSSEMLLLPSRGENFGIAVAEALACGVPVLISDKVNIWREVQEDGAGLVDTDDLSGACRMLAQWVGMPVGERGLMAANARPCFLRRFEIHAAAQSLMKLLTAVVGGRALPSGREECSTANS